MLESVTLGVFCALDTVLFFLFWELTLIPLYFLISLWGIGPDRRYAAVKYTLFMLVGGVPLLFAFLLLAFNHADFSGRDCARRSWCSTTRELLAHRLPESTETVVFLLLLAGFAVKTPVFPLHTWLPVVAMEGPVAVAALMTGLKLGAYGLIRFAVPLAPGAAQELHWLLAGLGVDRCALRRGGGHGPDQSAAHARLCVHQPRGSRVAGHRLLQPAGHAGGAVPVAELHHGGRRPVPVDRFLHQRLGSTDLIGLGGAGRSMPLLAAFFFVFALASLGVPGTAGFPAEFLILMSTLKSHTGAGLAALFAMVLGAAYVLDSYRRTFYGPVAQRRGRRGAGPAPARADESPSCSRP